MKIRSVKFTAKQTLCLMISLAFGSLVLVEISWYGSRYGDRPAAINNQQWKYVSNLFIGKAWTRKPISTEEPAICERSRQFIFSKTHKTGSSTVQNILMRQVFHQNLSLVMPAKRTWLFPLLTQFSANANIVADYYNQTQKRANTFDAFLYHATWNYREMRRMVPKGPVITILRDPIDMFESGYSYFQRKPKDINQFAKENVSTLWPPRPSYRVFGKQNMLWDLGMRPTKDLEDVHKVQKKIQALQTEFDLVMIAERMDESLVLLADLMCWPLDDVAYITQNKRKSDWRNVITTETRQVLEQWLWADYLLYDHFRSILDKKVQEYNQDSTDGNLMAEKTSELRSKNLALKERCVERTASQAELRGQFKVAMPSVLGYKIKPNSGPECNLHAMSEPYFALMLRRKQFPNQTQQSNQTTKHKS